MRKKTKKTPNHFGKAFENTEHHLYIIFKQLLQ